MQCSQEEGIDYVGRRTVLSTKKASVTSIHARCHQLWARYITIDVDIIQFIDLGRKILKSSKSEVCIVDNSWV